MASLWLLITGPVLSTFITPDLMEQASIWCFFSIAQTLVIMFCVGTVTKGQTPEARVKWLNKINQTKLKKIGKILQRDVRVTEGCFVFDFMVLVRNRFLGQM